MDLTFFAQDSSSSRKAVKVRSKDLDLPRVVGDRIRLFGTDVLYPTSRPVNASFYEATDLFSNSDY